jgi:hypothetical protein
MSEKPITLNSQEKLADEIIQELVVKKLISIEKQKELKHKIFKGTLKPEDWSLFIDLAVEQEIKGDIHV